MPCMMDTILCCYGSQREAMDEEHRQFTLNGKTFKEGDFISIDGNSGKIFDGIIPAVKVPITDDYCRVMVWADMYRK